MLTKRSTCLVCPYTTIYLIWSSLLMHGCFLLLFSNKSFIYASFIFIHCQYIRDKYDIGFMGERKMDKHANIKVCLGKKDLINILKKYRKMKNIF